MSLKVQQQKFYSSTTKIHLALVLTFYEISELSALKTDKRFLIK